MSETRRMTADEHRQGWYAMACGKHAYVWRSDVLRRLATADTEYCDCTGERFLSVRVDALQRLAPEAGA